MCASMPNCYSTTAGSLIQTLSLANFKSSNPLIINKTLLDSTTAGSLIRSTVIAEHKNRNCLIINKTRLDQRPPVR